ncbi:NAD(P)H-binding protein [Actinomyces viscosus]|uniref:NAD(P)H-binding protein n=1 Tax=Actinomyces viscosus TaxID=1656 RepID=UPI0028E2E63B|nr:NAD(P)H-binding protein [Actinomyces viscosus]
MRIVVLGATGMAGAAVANEAARRGHDVTAVSRRRRLQSGSHLTPCLLDVTDVDAVESLLKECDAAVVSLRTPPGRENGDELERPGGEQHFAVIASVPEATAVGTAGGETD